MTPRTPTTPASPRTRTPTTQPTPMWTNAVPRTPTTPRTPSTPMTPRTPTTPDSPRICTPTTQHTPMWTNATPRICTTPCTATPTMQRAPTQLNAAPHTRLAPGATQHRARKPQAGQSTSAAPGTLMTGQKSGYSRQNDPRSWPSRKRCQPRLGPCPICAFSPSPVVEPNAHFMIAGTYRRFAGVNTRNHGLPPALWSGMPHLRFFSRTLGEFHAGERGADE
jgi:hypothetical protein